MVRNLYPYLPYLPLMCICLASIVMGAYSYDVYLRTYAILYNFKVYIENIDVVKVSEVFLIKINFSIFNPSGNDLKLVYLKPDIYLNGRIVMLEEPSFERFTGLNEVSLLSHKNTTVCFQKRVASEDFGEVYGNAVRRHWLVNVYVTLKGVPLFELATLRRYVQFVEG